MSYLIASDLNGMTSFQAHSHLVGWILLLGVRHVVVFLPGAWQMVEMACSMLPSRTSHLGMTLGIQAGSWQFVVDPYVGQAR